MKRFLLLALLGVASHAATPPVTSACPAVGNITVDGQLSEEAWQYTVVTDGMSILSGKTVSTRPVEARFVYTAEALYVGVTCGEAAGVPKPAARERDGAVYADEAVELYVQPSVGMPYYHLVTNVAGLQYDALGTDAGWNGEWTVRTARTAASWELEAKLPWAMFGLTGPPEPGTTWHVNVAGNDRVNRQYYSWSPLKRGFHEPESFGSLRFVAIPLGIGPCRITREGIMINTAVEIRNPPGVPRTVAAALEAGTPTANSTTPMPLELLGGATGQFRISGAAAWHPSQYLPVEYRVSVGDVVYVDTPTFVVPMSRIRPELPAAPEPVTIANDTVSLTFDRATGRLLAAANRAAGLDLSFGPTGTAILELDTVGFMKNPHLFRPEDIRTFVGGPETMLGFAVDGREVKITHGVGESLVVVTTIRVPPTGTETEWRIEVDNRPGLHPSKALVVHRVRFPILHDLPEGAVGDDPAAILPSLMGTRIPAPAKNLHPTNSLSYLGRASMGWLDVYGSKGGLYLKVGDIDPLPQTELLAQGDAKAGTLTLGIERWALCWPGDTWTPGPCTVAVHAGDWHTAADLYRAWFRQTFTPYPKPEWLAESDAYVMSGAPTYEFADFPRILDNAMAAGINYIQLWSEMTGGEITYHAFFHPNPYMGTEAELTAAIAKVHEQGGHIGFYLNYNTGDPLLGRFVRQPRIAQKLAADIPLPPLDYMTSGWLQQALMSPAGEYSGWGIPIEGYIDDYWNMCPAADQWSEYYRWWVAEKWAKEYGADVWYLDSCPVSRGAPCFATDHGHTRPQPEGQAIVDFYKRLRASVPAGFGIMQEYNSDRLLPYSTHALGLVWHAPYAHPEVLRYTLPEYALFSGMCNGTKRLDQFYPGEKVTPKDALERVFLIGNRYEFSISNRPPDMVSQWMAKMVALRRVCRPEMNHGDFLDDIGLGPFPERVLGRLFRRADRGRLAMTLLDRRLDDRPPFPITMDLARAGVGRATKVDLVTLDGRQEPPVWSQDGDILTVTVPTFADRPAALLVDTEVR